MPEVTALILAAGQSKRMQKNKLLLPWRDRTILEEVVSIVTGTEIDKVIVVTGFEDHQIRQVLADSGVRIAYNPEFAMGMSTSIRRGVLATDPGTEGYMIFLADMPKIRADTISKLVHYFKNQKEPSIVIAKSDNKRGNPCIFHRHFRSELLKLNGDNGARSIINTNPNFVHEIEVDDPGIFFDIDTQETYEDDRRRNI